MPVTMAPDVVDDGTRREFVAGGLSPAALLAGCGGDDRAEPAPASASSSTTSSAICAERPLTRRG